MGHMPSFNREEGMSQPEAEKPKVKLSLEKTEVRDDEREQEIIQELVEKEMVKLGLDKLTFTPETAREDWVKMFDYYGAEVLPHALCIYGVSETLEKFAPQYNEGNCDLKKLDKAFRERPRYKGDDREYIQPFDVPLEFTINDTDFVGIIGRDHTFKLGNYRRELTGLELRDEDERGEVRAFHGGKPIFLGKEQFESVKKRLLSEAIDRLGKENFHYGTNFLGDIRKRIKGKIETEREYGPERVLEWKKRDEEQFGRWAEHIQSVLAE